MVALPLPEQDMKKLRGIISEVREATQKSGPAYNKLLWQLICYSPKMPLRFQQQLLLNEAKKFSLKVFDPYFSDTELSVNGFIWGEGKFKIYLTHGWASKAADSDLLIIALREIPDVQIIAFDAPGNGSSLAELTNAPLFICALNEIIETYGKPHVLIGHSIGTMANMVSLKETGSFPKLLIGITPLIRLKENFEATMTAAEVPPDAQEGFFTDFEKTYGPIDQLNATKLYTFKNELKYWVAYDEYDRVSPYEFIKEFLDVNPQVTTQSFIGAGHDKIIKDPALIAAIVKQVSAITNP